MILEQNTTVMILTDTIKERNEYIEIYKKKGYLLIGCGAVEKGFWLRMKIKQ